MHGNHEVHLLKKCVTETTSFNNVQFYAESSEKALAYAKQLYPKYKVHYKCKSENLKK